MISGGRRSDEMNWLWHLGITMSYPEASRQAQLDNNNNCYDCAVTAFKNHLFGEVSYASKCNNRSRNKAPLHPPTINSVIEWDLQKGYI